MTRSTSLGGRIAADSRSAIAVVVAIWALSVTGSLRADSRISDEPVEEPVITRGALLERTRLKIQSVHDHINSGEPEKAMARIDQLGGIIPEAERLYLQGRAHLQLGAHLTARTKFREAIRRRPRCGEFYFWLGISYQSGGAHALAASTFAKANLKGLESSELHEAWAASLMETVDVLGDISRMRFELPAEEWQVHGGIFRDGVLVSCVRPDDNEWVISPRTSALYHAQQAAALDESRGSAWLIAGEAWARAGFHDVASLRFMRAVELLDGAELSKCHQLWAESLFSAADYDGFIDHAKKSIRNSPKDPRLDLAEAYDRAAAGHALIGETDKQINCLKFAVELRPSVERQLRLADALLATERSDEATVRLRDAMAMNPSRSEKRQIKRRLIRVTQLTTPGRR